jgi:hypothetical protein
MLLQIWLSKRLSTRLVARNVRKTFFRLKRFFFNVLSPFLIVRLLASRVQWKNFGLRPCLSRQMSFFLWISRQQKILVFEIYPIISATSFNAIDSTESSWRMFTASPPSVSLSKYKLGTLVELSTDVDNVWQGIQTKEWYSFVSPVALRHENEIPFLASGGCFLSSCCLVVWQNSERHL